jgi:transcriptional regulator with XRE-family HTH domain
VEGTTVNEGYLSQLINRRKTNPTQAYLQEIADFLGIPVQCFYRLPPSRDALGELAGLDPLTLSRLGSARPPGNKAK